VTTAQKTVLCQGFRQIMKPAVGNSIQSMKATAGSSIQNMKATAGSSIQNMKADIRQIMKADTHQILKAAITRRRLRFPAEAFKWTLFQGMNLTWIRLLRVGFWAELGRVPHPDSVVVLTPTARQLPCSKQTTLLLKEDVEIQKFWESLLPTTAPLSATRTSI